MGQPTGPRHYNGFKAAAECWRTINGVRWPQRHCDPTAEIVAAYRAAGIRYRKVKHKDGGSDLFVHPEDHGKAEQIDRKVGYMFG
ncbi:hypothetical protein [Methylobacterium dankookense]|uniref:Uncharacterized protein n=1 Tax=Methylobacterium dankookense TaxID=560405 RepID=A0A564G511_9HYPH|nr:hypothetical protein [Methylobacterium dankookense]GJD58135.1 hypothetical protein IFDJLNFL_4050 [Methylobacterium dankookense]VUF15086.1 hypothetical protein MTDSW087_04819 [Methylobacterium dankookense]